MNNIEKFRNSKIGLSIRDSKEEDVYELERLMSQYHIMSYHDKTLSEYWLEHIESESEYEFIFVNQEHNCYDAAKVISFIDRGPKLSADKIIGYSIATFTISENDFDCVLMGD